MKVTYCEKNFKSNLHQFYDYRLISSQTNIIFPPQFFDLTPLGYFLFPRLKNTISRTPVNTIAGLIVRYRIKLKCESVSQQVLTSNLVCSQGQHFQPFL